MDWQQKVGVIVMLCPTVGLKGDESLDDWRGVDEKNRSAVIEGDGFKFRLTLVQQSQVNERIVRRRLRLQRDGYESESSPCFERCSAASQASDEGMDIVQPQTEKVDENSLLVDHNQDLGWPDNTAD